MMQARRAAGGTGAKRKISRTPGRPTATARKKRVPPMTHQKALFGFPRVVRML